MFNGYLHIYILFLCMQGYVVASKLQLVNKEQFMDMDSLCEGGQISTKCYKLTAICLVKYCAKIELCSKNKTASLIL